MAKKREAADLLQSDVQVVNVGLAGFAQDLQALGVPVQDVDWSPPAGGDPELASLLSKMGP